MHLMLQMRMPMKRREFIRSVAGAAVAPLAGMLRADQVAGEPGLVEVGLEAAENWVDGSCRGPCSKRGRGTRFAFVSRTAFVKPRTSTSTDCTCRRQELRTTAS